MSLRAVILACLSVAAISLEAQVPARTPAATHAPRSMRASRATSAPKIDGHLDDAVWAEATPSADFTQSYPNAGAAATEKSEVRILYDDDALFVGVRMFDAKPDSIAAQLARRDASGIYSDWLHVVVDSYHDRRTGFRFSVNPRGVQKDVLHSDDRNEDLNWDAVWEVGTSVDSLGWTAEYRIPFSQLRFGGAAKGVERIWDSRSSATSRGATSATHGHRGHAMMPAISRSPEISRVSSTYRLRSISRSCLM